MEKNLGWLYALAVFSLVLTLGILGIVYNQDSSIELTDSQVLTLGESITVNVEAPVVELNDSSSSSTASGDYVLTRDDYESDMEDAEALRLANESVESRDFRKAAFDVLVFNNVSVDSWRDVEVDVRDSDVDGNEVELEVKLYYFLDGDEDETEKARLEDFTITVDDLDFDEDFDDTEVDESYMDSLVLKNIYD